MGMFKSDEKKRSGHKAAAADTRPETAKDPGPGVLMPLTGVSAPRATEAGSGSDSPDAAASGRGCGSPPSVGSATTFTGKIVADEDLEVLGTVEGTIHLDQHHLTVGASGVVKADVEANSVLVIGRVTGNVCATDVIEVRSGGYVGGDLAAPRIIMADGSIVIGSLDMKAALPKDLVDHEPPKLETPKTVGDVYRTRSDDPA
jgi:cytoskeletal protein CcmA (bactofilin family)